MILDYNYNKNGRKLNLSYINNKGQKQLLTFNINRFKSYYSKDNGPFTNWDGTKCDVQYVETPSKFDIKTFITELDESKKKLLLEKQFPKIYTFDIEVLADANGEYSEAEYAKNEISTISICSQDLNTIVLGTVKLDEHEQLKLTKNFENYVNNTEYFSTLKLKMPYIKYVQFENEEKMLKYFISNIVAKVPILTGWNCIRFDWQYIVNRIKNFYPNISIKESSYLQTISEKQYTDRFGNKFTLPMPDHTLIIDMMETIEQYDKKVLPMKESMKLDYIASESMGIHKIQYERTLTELYRSDYQKYVFYNAIDSFLVQLIIYKFKVLDSIFLIALHCNEKIVSCFSKILITEALIFNEFYKQGLKVVYDKKDNERGKLVGAYVKKSVPGIHQYVCCNDFASLYPSTIRTCNLSIENYVGEFWDEAKLLPFRKEPAKYVVIGPNVFENEHTIKEPKAGKLLYTFLDEEGLKPYRNKNYFVSVNGCVYKNDKDYAFRKVQSELQTIRNRDKYLCKKLDAQVMLAIKLLKSNKYEDIEFSDDVIQCMHEFGFNCKSIDDIKALDQKTINDIEFLIGKHIVYLDSNQKAMKDIMNSMYGGASHINFYWYNMNFANDITGESRNLIHLMESHLAEYWKTAWQNEPKLLELQKKHNIKLKSNIEINDIITNSPQQSLCTLIYGDSVDKNSVIKTNIGDLTIEDLYDYLQDFHIWHNKDAKYGNNIKVGTIENNKYTELPIKRVIKHNTNKPKWKIKTKSGKEIIVTGDHSIIVMRNNERLECKPSEILKTDKLICIK